MDDERLDLTPLDPRADRLRWERLVRSVVAAAGPELARRASPGSALGVVGAWARPALSAAAVIAVLAAGALVLTERSAPAPRVATATSEADALGVPAPVSEWLAEGRAPSEADLVLAMERR